MHLHHCMLALAEGFEPGPVAALLDPDLDVVALAAGLPAVPEGLEVPPRVRRRLADPGLAARARALFQHAAAAGLAVLTPDAPRYPARLRNAPGRPLVLFAHGRIEALEHVPAIAVVGSRAATAYGQLAAEDFASALARAGVAVWSGLARGIDGIAHEATLLVGGTTVAVMAGGLDATYPPEHEPLARRIVEAGGCLLAELPPGMRATRGHFLRRNRILAAATPATLVVEAGLASGALVTAGMAAAAGATVYAVPGPYTSEQSKGCHQLLGEGAQLAPDPVGLLRGLGIDRTATPQAARALELGADAEAVLRLLAQGPRPLDLAYRESRLERAAFFAALHVLQREGLVRQLPGSMLAAVRVSR